MSLGLRKADLDRAFGGAWHVNQDRILRLLSAREDAGTPVSVVTPDFLGQEYYDTTNDLLYVAKGLTSADWVKTVQRIEFYTVNFNPASVAAATTAEQTITVAGAEVGDGVIVQKPTLSAGLGIAGARVTAANTVGITYINATAAPIDAGAEDYIVTLFKG